MYDFNEENDQSEGKEASVISFHRHRTAIDIRMSPSLFVPSVHAKQQVENRPPNQQN